MKTAKPYRPPHSRGSSRSTSSLSSTDDQLQKRRERFNETKHAEKQSKTFGLISRGEDNRLQRDPKAREEFFKQIQNEFTEEFFNDDVKTIRQALSNLSLEEKNKQQTEKSEKIDQILLSLRKLREALLKFEPDEFSKTVFLFSIRVSTRIGHYQTYIPSITFLLQHKTILTKQELHEVATYHVLHLCHIGNNDQITLEAQQEYCKDDVWLQEVIKSWRTQNFKTWFELYSSEKDASKARIMRFGEDKMTGYAIKCLQKSYFQLPKAHIEKLFHQDIDTLLRRDDCSWSLNDSTVVIRSRK